MIPSSLLLLFCCIQLLPLDLLLLPWSRRKRRGFLQKGVVLRAGGPGEWLTHQFVQAGTVCSWSFPVVLSALLLFYCIDVIVWGFIVLVLSALLYLRLEQEQAELAFAHTIVCKQTISKKGLFPCNVDRAHVGYSYLDHGSEWFAL